MRKQILFSLILTLSFLAGIGQTTMVRRIIDCDTFETADSVKVHLIGIDASESAHPQRPVEYLCCWRTSLCAGAEVGFYAVDVDVHHVQIE